MPRSTIKGQRVEARVTEAQRELLKHAAGLRGQSVSEFIVASAHAAAEETVRSHQVTLSARGSRAMMEALLNPPPPNEQLRRAAAAFGDATSR